MENEVEVSILGKWDVNDVTDHQNVLKSLLSHGPIKNFYVSKALLKIAGPELLFTRTNKDLIVKFKMQAIKEPTAFVKKGEAKSNLTKVIIFRVDRGERKPGIFVALQCLSSDPHKLVEEMVGALDELDSDSHYQEPDTRPGSGLSNSTSMIYASVHRRNGSSSLSMTSELDVQPVQQQPSVEKNQIARTETMVMNKPSFIYDHSDDPIEKNKILLNYCTDDIMSFCRELQDSKMNIPGSRGVTSYRASEFMVTFQKVKLTFNLLVKLNPHIRDPAATDILHYIMPDLEFLIQQGLHMFEDAIQCNVTSPLLSSNAIQFLGHALTSKERDTWDSCGTLWQTSRSEYSGDYVAYKPVFSDGWSSGYIEDDLPIVPTPVPERPMSPIYTATTPMSPIYAATTDIQRMVTGKPISVSTNGNDNDSIQLINTPLPDYETEENENFRDQLLEENANVVLVIYPWAPRSRKELEVNKGEYLEALETTKQWWMCRNIDNQTGYLPCSILTTLVKARSVWQNDQIEKARKLVERAQSFSPERPLVKPKPLPPPRRHSPPPPRRQSPPPSRPASPSPSIPPPAPPIPADGPPSIPSTPLILPKKFKPKMMNGMDSLRSNHSMQEELAMVLTLKNAKEKNFDIHRTPDVFIDSRSTVSEVRNWMKMKDFDSKLRNALEGYDGKQILTLRKKDLENFFGHEGLRLDSQITLSRNKSHYTQGKSSELREILAKAKMRAENFQQATDEMEQFFKVTSDEATA